MDFRSETVDLNALASTADIFKLERVRSAGRGAPGAPVGTPQAEGQPQEGGAGAGAGTTAGEQTVATA